MVDEPGVSGVTGVGGTIVCWPPLALDCELVEADPSCSSSAPGYLCWDKKCTPGGWRSMLAWGFTNNDLR